jgi:uncharacterized protein (DUF488 family)
MLIFTIGHSTTAIEKFVEILKAHQIETLVDIRTIPNSKRNPQFGQDSLSKTVLLEGIEYHHLKSLGGLRNASQNSINMGWQNPSFRGFADYMQTDEFNSALNKLIDIAQVKRTAIMCAEGNPYRCHRSLVADALTIREIEVRHISSAKSANPHRLTPFAKVDGIKVWYPAADGGGQSNISDIPK